MNKTRTANVTLSAVIAASLLSAAPASADTPTQQVVGAVIAAVPPVPSLPTPQITPPPVIPSISPTPPPLPRTPDLFNR